MNGVAFVPRASSVTAVCNSAVTENGIDLVGRDLDLGLVAVDAESAQVRAGRHGWGPVIPLDQAAAALTALAVSFVERAGTAPNAPWHVDELDGGGTALLGAPRKRRVETRIDRWPWAG